MRMADDWEKDDFEPPSITAAKKVDNRWEGEDEEEDVKDSWDQADDNTAKNETSTTVTKKKKRNIQQIIAEKEEKKRLEAEERRKKLESEQAAATPEGQLAEKLRRQKLQEEADLQLAKECFGAQDSGISSQEGFDELRKLIVTRLAACDPSPLYVAFLDELVREVSVALEADDVKRLSSTLTAVYNEKIKQQKAAKGKKKSTKAKLTVGKGGEMFDDDLGNEYDDFM